MTAEKIEKIDKISRGSETDAVLDTAEVHESTTVQPNKEHFDALMQDKTTIPAQPVKETDKVSLMETVRNSHQIDTRTGKATFESLLSQTKEALIKIDEIKKTLETPDISIKTSVRNLLQNKLSHIDDGLKIALTKVNAEYNASEDLSVTEAKATDHPGPARVNPIERFLGFVADGQYQLAHLSDQLQVMGATGKELTPTNMLAIQVKMGWIQQELELFSNMLNKSLESIKTIMNIQV